MNAFEFVVVSGLRAGQLQRGCTPLVERGEKVIVTAQREVAERKVLRMPAAPDVVPDAND
jgi:DNA-directed RNA polymerase subunit K/omega